MNIALLGSTGSIGVSTLDVVQIGNTMIAAAVFLGQTRLIDNVRF